MSIAPDFLQQSSSVRKTKMAKKDKMAKAEKPMLTAKQKKLPPALQKAMMKKKGAK